MTNVRTEGVGSQLRTTELLEARARHEAGELDAAAFKRIEDHAVDEAVAVQEAVGLDVVSDGELRRRGWMTHFYEAVDGLEAGGGPGLPWRDVDPDNAGEVELSRRPVVVDKLRWKRSACAEEWVYLRGRATGPAKMTLPSAEMAAALYSEEKSSAAYPTREEYFADVVDILRRELTELVRLGGTYIQLDAPQYGALLDPTTREVFRQQGSDPDQMIDAGIEMDNAIIADFPGITFGLHICRGNNQSKFYAEGDYSPISRLFKRANFDRYLLEYDDERSGGFQPLRDVREDAVVVLGLITTKRSAMESAEEIRARIEEASAYVPLERLALSPQCGFASMMEGNAIDEDAQRRKLELVIEVARSVWG
ncbi:MAG: cobalamin-independent methionine synthase II family protein [Solirubrobacteraceae bacterium]